MRPTIGHITASVDQLLAEQIAYYRARAPEYLASAGLEGVGAELLDTAKREILAKIDQAAPFGSVLELACGPGTFTERLLRHASSLTALDASPEMLALAARNVGDDQVRFLEADLFTWRPDRRYDFVFFSFWLSHVPLERFEQFWEIVAAALVPGGRVFFVDDAFRTDDELIEGPASSTILRRLSDGTAFRAVKVPHEPAGLELRIRELGWQIEVSQLTGTPFFTGIGCKPSEARG